MTGASLGGLLRVRPRPHVTWAPPERTVTGRAYEVANASSDLVLAASVGVLASPVLGAIAAAIKLEGRGPILFRQERVGRHGRPSRS